jgi:hypothetical protein
MVVFSSEPQRSVIDALLISVAMKPLSGWPYMISTITPPESPNRIA